MDNGLLPPIETTPLYEALWGFEDDWQDAREAGRPRPDPATAFSAGLDLLPGLGGPMARELALCLAIVDLEHRLRLGDEARLDEYRNMFPPAEFGVDEIRELVRTEYLGRLFQGDDVLVESYEQRCPGECDEDLVAELRELRVRPENDPREPRYRKANPHRRGGLGAVYLALDRRLRRRVAIKELDAPSDGRGRERCDREARIAARLDHPGIVTIHDHGQWHDGRPFYVMRFVAGPTLAHEINRLHREPPRGAGLGAMDLRSLIERFRSGCQAVAHAHDQRIAHLDLKPHNILLGPYGETVVVDWGSARRLGAVADEADSAGTPAYMSPEQAHNELNLLDEKTDVFNLGATLYHVLSGRAPFGRGRADPPQDEVAGGAAETKHRSAEHVDQSPLTGTFPAPREIVPQIDRALEAICLKAMSADRGQRYPNAGQLLVDIEQWLADEPVRAYAEPFTATALRWARRHRTIVATAGVLFLAGMIGLFAALGFQRRHSSVLASKNLELERANTRARRAAEAARSRARIGAVANNAIVSTVREDEQLADPALKPLRDRLLRLIFKNLEQWKNELDRHRDDDPSTLSDLAAACALFATISGDIGSKRDALDAFEEARALRDDVLRRTLVSDKSATLQASLDLATAWVDVGEAQREAGQVTESVRTLERGQALLKSLIHSGPNAPEFDRELRNRIARSLMDLGRALREAGKLDGAIDTYKQALAFAESAAASPALDLENLFDRAGLLANLGNAARNTDSNAAHGFYQRATQLYKELVEQARQLNDPRLSKYRREEALCSFNYGGLQNAEGHAADALKSLERAQRTQQQLVHADPGLPLLRSDLAATQFELAELLARTNVDPSAVRRSFLTTIELQARLVNERPDFPQAKYELAMTTYRLGIYEWQKANAYGEAKKYFERAVSVLEPLVASNPANVKYRLELAKTNDYLNIVLNKLSSHVQAIEVEARSIQALKGALETVPATEKEAVQQLCAALIRAYINQTYSHLAANEPGNALIPVASALEVFESRYRAAREDRFLRDATSNMIELLNECRKRFGSASKTSSTTREIDRVQNLLSRAEKLVR